MKVLSIHGPGSKAAAWNTWYTHMGIALPEAIGDTTHIVDRGQGTWEGGTYTMDLGIEEDFDIAYIQPFIVPTKRPAPFIYTFVSDYQKVSGALKMKKWIKDVRPNLVGSLQTIPNEFVEYGKKYGCLVKLIPWFVIEKLPFIEEKEITAMCTGVIGGSYPNRTQINNYLKNLNRKDVVAVCGKDRTNFSLSNEKYEYLISRTKYYMSGGIHNQYIPPKYYEVCNAGACLVSHGMPLMEQCGFIDGKTYIKINDMNDIKKVLRDSRWQEIGKAGQKMIQDKHTVDVRAKEIVNCLYYQNN